MELIHNILSPFIKPWAVQAAGQPFVYFEYNPVGDNTRVYSSVANDWERNYTYDMLGRRLTYQEGELAESYTYNGGNLATHTQRWLENGQPRTKTTQFHYNAHRLDSVGYDDALTTIYHYDKYGRVDSLYDESGVMCYEYGNMGEVTRETRIYALPFLAQQIALTTHFSYDSWGRILNITYPDNEVVNYAYDLGGQLQSISNNSSYTYLDNVTYDRFGAKVSQTYGNGLVTDYTYENLTRRLSQISVTDNSSNPYSDIQYGYDPVGNVIQANSNCPWYPAQGFMEIFTYDASDQLTAATEMQNQSYSLSVTYGNWGKITSYSLAQTDLQNNTTQSETQAYTYPAANSIGGSQSLFAPASRSIQKPGQPHSVQTFTFGINGSLRRREVSNPQPYTEYYLFNSAANMKAYSNNGLDVAYYGYNASNYRSYKLSFLNQNQWVNGQPEPLDLQLQNAMFYPNAYVNFNHNGEYTKHYYSGAERIASRLGENTLNLTTVTNSRLSYRTMQVDQQARADLLEVVEAGDVPIETPSVDVSTLQTTGSTTDIYYYHTNHLGSTAFVTDQSQNVTQGFLYAPFGEITTEFNATFGNNVLPKYSFNAKELDEETGMYYYEARYYKPPVFTSRDPMFEKYFWMTPYAYCANNPVKYVDPSGCTVYTSLLFRQSKYGAIYENVSKLSVYNKLITPFNNENVDLTLDATGTMAKHVLGKTEPCAPGKLVTHRNSDGKYDFMCIKSDFGGDQNEIGCVKTLLHEAIHANNKYNDIDDPQSHTGFDRQSVLEGLKQYNKEYLNSKYTDEQLNIISWGGLHESDEFKTYIISVPLKLGPVKY